MIDFKNNKFAVLDFVATYGFSNIEIKKNNSCININYPAILEVAAVKISKGKIVNHFSTFVAIEGCDPNDLRFETEFSELNGIMAEHLIGAPPITEVAQRLFGFTEGCAIITKFPAKDFRNPFNIIKKYAAFSGYIFNNPVIAITDIVSAVKIRQAVNDITNFKESDFFKFALCLKDKESYSELVSQYVDYCSSSDVSRQDSLTQALIMAKLFIAFLNRENSIYELAASEESFEPIDEDIPF